MSSEPPPPIRQATPGDFPKLALLWHDGWMEAHSAHVPEGLTRRRTKRSFLDRLKDLGDELRMAGCADAPLGLSVIYPGQVNQLFVSSAARGTGLAGRLLRDAEDRLRNAGHDHALLHCLDRNTKAAHFYEKHGWINSGVEPVGIEADGAVFDVPCIIFRKSL